MGNCQAAEAATVVVQHPGGRVERLYWATSAAEVMRANPGHYVALVTHRDAAGERQKQPSKAEAPEAEQKLQPRVTRVKLLKPRDTLLLGQAYRLITVSEVAKAMQAKDRTRRAQQQLLQSKHQAGGRTGSGGGDDSQLDDGNDQDRDNNRSKQQASTHSGARHRPWRPSLHSIAEVSG